MKSILTLFFIGLFLAFGSSVTGQTNQASFQKKSMTSSEKKVFDPKTAEPDLQVSLVNLEAPFPGGEAARDRGRALKQQVRERYPLKEGMVTGYSSKKAVPDLVQGTNFGCDFFFNGNPLLGGRPNDNTLAISDGGMVMASWNSQVYGYDIVADTYLFEPNNRHPTFGQFAQGFSLSFPFDPKLKYDPINDRFILVFLTGREPDDSGIIVAFSTTNNPSDPWNIYELDGNPRNNDKWTDYPAIALTEDELFLTVNLLYPDSSWQTGFSESIVWQIDLEDGYTGTNTLNTELWFDINHNGRPVRNLHPVQGGRKPYGPNLYLLSNRNFALDNDTIFLVEITGNLDDQNATLNVTAGITDTEYGFPPDGRQANGHMFQTNDARVLGGFLENNRIQFVANTVNPANGFAAVYHGFIDNVDNNPTFSGHIISDDVMDFGYPNIAYSGTANYDIESIIVFDHTAPTVSAGYSAINYTNEGEYSDVLTVKEGETYVDRISGTEERWGDYSGIQRKYDEPGKVWTAAYYSFNTQFHNNSTWISEIISPGRVSNTDDITSKEIQPKLFPVPATERLTVQFSVETSTKIEVELYGLNGQLIRKILRAPVNKGANEVSFNISPLADGIYIVKVMDEAGEPLVAKQFVKGN